MTKTTLLNELGKQQQQPDDANNTSQQATSSQQPPSLLSLKIPTEISASQKQTFANKPQSLFPILNESRYQIFQSILFKLFFNIQFFRISSQDLKTQSQSTNKSNQGKSGQNKSILVIEY
jgi:hypothetical protein